MGGWGAVRRAVRKTLTLLIGYDEDTLRTVRR